MSVEKRVLPSGEVRWRVRWREAGRNRARVFALKRDAVEYDGKVGDMRRRGELGLLDAGRQTLGEFAEEWWERYATRALAPRTLASYASVWDTHIEPRLGDYRLRELSSNVIDQWRGDLLDAGVGEPTVRRAMSLLQGVLRQAVVWGHIRSNPVREVRKPAAPIAQRVTPVTPIDVEMVRAALGDPRDRALVSVLAHAGLRPQEALLLRVEDLGQRTLRVLSPKTRRHGRAERQVTALPALLSDLRAYLLASGVRDGLLFPHPHGEWSDDAYRAWRRRRYAPAAKRAGLTDLRPYLLRASFGSWLVAEGRSVEDVAAQMGNSPAVVWRHYARQLAERDPGERWSLGAAVAAARDPKSRLTRGDASG